MDDSVKYSIIIPAYLEEENLHLILPRLTRILAKIDGHTEVLVVDTVKEMDNTKTVCLENGALYIHRENSDSYGDAVKTGIKYAKGEYTLFMDADGSHPPEFVTSLIANLNGSDVVIASRYITGGKTDNNKLLIFMSLVVNVLYSFILGIRAKDVSNSFKLYKTDQLKRLELKCKNFDIVEEILFKLVRSNKNFKIKEIPFSFKKRMFGHTKRNLFAFMISYLVTIIRLRFDLHNKK